MSQVPSSRVLTKNTTERVYAGLIACKPKGCTIRAVPQLQGACALSPMLRLSGSYR